MARKKIILKDIEPKLGSGNEGLYYKLNDSVGVKIPGADYEDIQAEAENLKLVNKRCPGIFPKFYGIVTVSISDQNLKGLLLEHIDGDTFDELDAWQFNEESIYGGYDYFEHNDNVNELKARLKKNFLDWKDDHPGNIILTKTGEIRFIDTGSNYLYDRKPKD